MPLSDDKLIGQLQKTIQEQAQTIDGLNSRISDLLATINNLIEQLNNLERKLYGRSSEKTTGEQADEAIAAAAAENKAAGDGGQDEGEPIVVKEHTRSRGKKSRREDLYSQLPVVEVCCDVPEDERWCPDCGARMEHLGYVYSYEVLRYTPPKLERVQYKVERLVCPACREEGDTTIVSAQAPASLMQHSPASPDLVAMVMYQKFLMDVPLYRQEKDWLQKGVPLPRSTTSRWLIYCAIEYLYCIYERLHQIMVEREILHIDEVPCQVLREDGRAAEQKSYFWIYLTGTDGKPKIVLYDYEPGRSGDYPIAFLRGFTGLVHCDGYQAYGRLEDVILICCLAHCRRKFFEAIPIARRKKLKMRLLDINSDEAIPEPKEGTADDSSLLPAEKGVAFCNRIFFKERLYKGLPADERKARRLETEPQIWDEFWTWLYSLNPTGGSKLEKAVNYAKNHKDSLMAYLADGRCEVSNNCAERKAKSYVMGRKNFLFHVSQDGATASAIILSLIETAKENNLNVYMYLYTLLLYLPDYKNEPAGIEQLLPWSGFIKERCSGITDIESYRPEKRGKLPLPDTVADLPGQGGDP